MRLGVATDRGLAWAQGTVRRHHYLHAPVDDRCSPMVYLIYIEDVSEPLGCLIFGRPESTRCYDGKLTYGGAEDIATGRAQYDRWEILNLARVWLDPIVQWGGDACSPRFLPGNVNKKTGIWHSHAASWCIREALRRVNADYLRAYLPVDCAHPYQIRGVLSYCDTSLHTGTIYQQAGFQLARTNEAGIQTWWTTAVRPLTAAQDWDIRRWSAQSLRGRVIRSKRAAVGEQLPLT